MPKAPRRGSATVAPSLRTAITVAGRRPGGGTLWHSVLTTSTNRFLSVSRIIWVQIIQQSGHEMSKVWRNILLGSGALLTIFAAYLLVGPDSRRTALLKRLESEGLVAQAKVIEKHVEEHVSYDDSGSRAGRRSVGRIIRDHNRRAESATVDYLYFVDVEFKTAQGQTVRSKESILGEHFDGITVGAQVPILYHPEDPSDVSRLRDHASPYRDMSEIYRIMAMFTMTVAAVLFWFGWPRGDEGEDSGDRGWQKSASDRIAKVGEARNTPSPVPARRAAAAQPAAPKGFGQRGRSMRT